jgi:hypothetical protein
MEEINNQSLFNRLKRLFSTNVIVRNVGGKKLKVVDTDEVQFATDRHSLRDRFNRLRSSTYNLHNRDMAMSYQAARLELFRDYDVMDMDPIISAALDIYADECVTESEMGDILTITSEDENIKEILENLFKDILNVEFNLWSWVRNMVKYGDFFLKLDISPEYGIYTVVPLSAYEVTRVEGSNPDNMNYVKFQHDGPMGGQEYENFEVAHFRLLGDSNFLPYGKSMLEGARRVWKQLSLMEDAMLIHRIMRAPEKRIFKIDIGNIAPSDVDPYMEKIISKMKKVPYIDERTGDYNLRFNLMNMVEDFFLPVRGGDSGTSIDSLPGMEFTGTDDIEYLRNKMMAALKIPKAFLGYDESIGGKATLAQEDIRFAKTIARIQRILVSELTKIAIVHLYVQGHQDASLVNFKLSLTNPSSIFEQEKISLWNDKTDLAKNMQEANLFSAEWIYKKIFGLSEGDIEEIQEQMVEDKKMIWRFAQIEEQGNDPATSGQNVNADGDLENAGGEPAAEPAAGGEAPLKEEEEKPERDQSGRKDAREYPFGEDPIGKLGRKEKTRSDPIRHSFRGGLFKINELERIKEAVKQKASKTTVAKEILTEKKSLLDESNILDDVSEKGTSG